MKNIFAIVMTATLSLSMFGAGSQYFVAVLGCSHLKELIAIGYAQEIKAIMHDTTTTYRCPGCYDFKVTIVNPILENEELWFQTELGLDDGKIRVRKK